MHAGVHAFPGCGGAAVQPGGTVYVIEFKLAQNEEHVPESISEGQGQMADKGYAEGYRAKGRRVLEAVVVVDDRLRQAVCLPAAGAGA